MHEKASDYMIQNLEQIEYHRGMFDKGMKPEDLPVKVWGGAEFRWTCARQSTMRTCSTSAVSMGARMLANRAISTPSSITSSISSGLTPSVIPVTRLISIA